MSATLELDLSPGPEAASTARIALRDLEAELSPELLKDVRLMVSELVTNSIRHVRRELQDRVQLRAWLFSQRLRIAVSDAGPGFEPVVRAGRAGEEGGWGLYIVASLADRWGVERADGRTHTWFEIGVRPRPNAAYAETG